MSTAGTAALSMLVARVKRELLAACMTCPLCHKLLRDATTISECLHTFCRKCIVEKLTDEETDCCPICQIDLGCIPEEKLRPDHNLQDVRSKIFPYKRKKDGSEVIPSITLPFRRKERSLSSLVVNTPRMVAPVSLTGRRTKVETSRARGPSQIFDESKKKGSCSDDLVDSSSTETLSKTAHSRRQISSNEETSSHTVHQDTKNSTDSYRSEMWKPLNCLVEVANRTKNVKHSMQTLACKEEKMNGTENDSHMHRAKVQDHPNKLKMQDGKIDNISTSSAITKSRLQGVCLKRKEQWPSAQAVLDVADATCERRICPVWLSLLSSSDQKGVSPLPQISASFLRIKEGNLPVSSLQKYLVKKLNLSNENEVEIACRGELINPTVSFHDLIEQWLSHEPSHRAQALVGGSAKDFIMVLTYSRKTGSS